MWVTVAIHSKLLTWWHQYKYATALCGNDQVPLVNWGWKWTVPHEGWSSRWQLEMSAHEQRDRYGPLDMVTKSDALGHALVVTHWLVNHVFFSTAWLWRRSRWPWSHRSSPPHRFLCSIFIFKNSFYLCLLNRGPPLLPVPEKKISHRIMTPHFTWAKTHFPVHTTGERYVPS